ncbi:DUF3923 family protein [Macrococcoides bohemicum]|uniref:DUF3923 family protein n=1 Tax=Macrococcoides bohemicum TaxID=1903056 RepID=UPI00165D2FB5|nr:DUF3923 family protein [Macrococcus bohemicus]MBC9873247.1 DUF3923 family protein [Macrococcus bohemicus]
MKISWILWWIVNLILVGSFIILSFIIFTRTIDGSGAEQTFELKLISEFTLVLFYIIPLIFQIIWLVVNLVKSKDRKSFN